MSFVEGKQAGSQAIELIKNERYDIVLTDRKMPGNDGWMVVEAIRAADSYRGKKLPTPVLMVRFSPLCCDLLQDFLRLGDHQRCRKRLRWENVEPLEW